MLHGIETMYSEKQRPLCVGFSGAGGKTSSIFDLVNELINMHQKVLITTTTKMFPQRNFQALQIVTRETIDDSLFDDWSAVQWFSEVLREDKGVGPSLEALAKMNKYPKIWKLIEIDGARRLSIKAPIEGEPVYCDGLDLVYGVIGASVFGQPIDGTRVHRLERFLEVTGSQEGQRISPEVVLALINHPQGLLRDLPEGAEGRILITQAKPEHEPFIAALKAQALWPVEVTPWRA